MKSLILLLALCGVSFSGIRADQYYALQQKQAISQQVDTTKNDSTISIHKNYSDSTLTQQKLQTESLQSISSFYKFNTILNWFGFGIILAVIINQD